MSTIIDSMMRLKPVFSTGEFALSLSKSQAYTWLVLNRLKNGNRIVHLKRGWWSKPNVMPEVAATSLSYPAYLSFHSALYVHGLTTQIPKCIQLAVSRKAKRYSVLGVYVKEYRIPSSLFHGFSVKDDLLLATPEKAFLDCLYLPRSCPDFILVEVLPKLNEKKIVELCNKAMKKRFVKVKKLCFQEKT